MTRRIGAAVAALAALCAIAIATRFLVGESSADLENPGRDTEPRVFTSLRDRIRMVVPRAWRATDQDSYPGLILWMLRSQPPGQVVLTSEAFTRQLYCSWPVACRAGQDPLTTKFACALRTKLTAQRLRVGPPQPGPKDNAAAGLPSVWFEYEDGKRFLRQAIALSADRAISLVLSAPTSDARASHARSFEQMLRSLRPMTVAEEAEAANAAAPPPGDAGISDGGAGRDAPPFDAGAAFESAPAPKIEPVGPCP